jgi:hypothetical protein
MRWVSIHHFYAISATRPRISDFNRLQYSSISKYDLRPVTRILSWNFLDIFRVWMPVSGSVSGKPETRWVPDSQERRIHVGSGFLATRNTEPHAGSPFPGTRNPPSTLYEETVKGYVNISLCLKMHKNEFCNRFAFLGSGTLREGNPHIWNFGVRHHIEKIISSSFLPDL